MHGVAQGRAFLSRLLDLLKRYTSPPTFHTAEQAMPIRHNLVARVFTHVGWGLFDLPDWARFTYVSSKNIFIEILFHRNSSLSKLYFIENNFRRRFVFVENMFPRKYVWSKSILSEVLFNRKHFSPIRIKSLGISGSGTFPQMLIS